MNRRICNTCRELKGIEEFHLTGRKSRNRNVEVLGDSEMPWMDAATPERSNECGRCAQVRHKLARGTADTLDHLHYLKAMLARENELPNTHSTRRDLLKSVNSDRGLD